MAIGHIVEAIDCLSAGSVSGHAFRHQPVEWNYSQPGAGARTLGGRWNPPNSFATLYLGLSLKAVEGEFARLAKRSGRDLADFLPRYLLEFQIELTALLDLTDDEAVESLGITTADLSSNDLTVCQQVGEAAHHLGREGILAPSAAGNGCVVALFIERLLPTSRLDLVSTTLWDIPQ